MNELGFLIFAGIFWLIFFGPQHKSAEKKDDKGGGKGGGKPAKK